MRHSRWIPRSGTWQAGRYSMVRADDARTCLDLVDAASAKRMTGVSHLNLRSSRFPFVCVFCFFFDCFSFSAIKISSYSGS